MKISLRKLTCIAVILCIVIPVTACAKPQYKDVVPGKGVYYEIYVNSFADSDGDKFGDLQGVINKLDYLNDGKDSTDTDLGVTGIWLMPIFTSPTSHKYDVEDFYSIDKKYGDMAVFSKLIDECNKRGIAVILDLVLNCSSSRNAWFKEACEDPNSKYREYYHFYDDNPDRYDLDATWEIDGNPAGIPSWHTVKTTGEKYLGIYSELMPDFNLDSPALREEFKNIASFWLDKGVSGFRLDSAMHLYSNMEVYDTDDFHAKNVEYWDEFLTHCKSIKEDVYIVGEVWSNTQVRAEYLTTMKSDFNFSVGGYVYTALKNGEDPDQLAKNLGSVYDAYNAKTTDYIDAPFLTNHDQQRVGTLLDNNTDYLKFAAATYLTLPGMPFIYYGEELGQQGDSVRNRVQFTWGKDDKHTVGAAKYMYDPVPYLDEMQKDKTSIWYVYQRIIKIRNRYKTFSEGQYSVYDLGKNVSAYTMTKDGQQALIVHNPTAENKGFNIDTSAYEMIYTTNAEQGFTGATVQMKPYNSIILIKK